MYAHATDVKVGEVIDMELVNGSRMVGYVDEIEVTDGRITFINRGQVERRSIPYRPLWEIDVLSREERRGSNAC